MMSLPANGCRWSSTRSSRSPWDQASSTNWTRKRACSGSTGCSTLPFTTQPTTGSSRKRFSDTVRTGDGGSIEMVPGTQASKHSAATSTAAIGPSAHPLRAVVIGGSGQLGCWLLWTLAQRGHAATGTYASVQFPGLARLDAGDLQAAADWITEQAADVVFYPAGFTWVDGCERDRSRAYAANLEQPLNLARAAATVGARFVYFSTDYVFDGEAGPYTEESTTNPLSVYG